MKTKLSIAFICIYLIGLAQTPKLYLNITSHNEMTATEPYDTNVLFYTQTRDTVKKIADMIYNKGAKYNLQSCQKFVIASHMHENAGTSSADILEYCYKLGGAPYGKVVEIDPRYKTQSPTYTLNMSDVAHMIDSTGATSSKTVGGFIYYPYASQDWSVYTTTIVGTVYNKPWKPNILWGSGSTPPHTHDANNYGIWKPKGNTDSLTFYCHDPAQNLSIEGNGCAWVIYDTTANIQWIIRDIRNAATKIVNGTYPNNKFYCATVMINFKHFQSAGLRAKLTTLIDSVNYMATQNKTVWATIGQKLTAFQTWSTANSTPYSQWQCGQTATLAPTCASAGIQEQTGAEGLLKVFPNPASSSLTYEWQGMFDNTYFNIYDNFGRLVTTLPITQSLQTISLNDLSAGVYFIQISSKEKTYKPQKLIVTN